MRWNARQKGLTLKIQKILLRFASNLLIIIVGCFWSVDFFEGWCHILDHASAFVVNNAAYFDILKLFAGYLYARTILCEWCVCYDFFTISLILPCISGHAFLHAQMFVCCLCITSCIFMPDILVHKCSSLLSGVFVCIFLCAFLCVCLCVCSSQQ